jgi:hypothetical protein
MHPSNEQRDVGWHHWERTLKCHHNFSQTFIIKHMTSFKANLKWKYLWKWKCIHGKCFGGMEQQLNLNNLNNKIETLPKFGAHHGYISRAVPPGGCYKNWAGGWRMGRGKGDGVGAKHVLAGTFVPDAFISFGLFNILPTRLHIQSTGRCVEQEAPLAKGPRANSYAFKGEEHKNDQRLGCHMDVHHNLLTKAAIAYWCLDKSRHFHRLPQPGDAIVSLKIAIAWVVTGKNAPAAWASHIAKRRPTVRRAHPWRLL